MVTSVFEHSTLYIDEDGFQRHHWRALGRYNEQHGGKYFTLLPDGVRFNNYVGVVQAGNLTIEILPKIQKEEEDKKGWRKKLIYMLHECRFLKVAHPERASLQLYSSSILDAYLQLYLEEVECLLHEGLSKRYRKIEGNRTALKGSLQFSQHTRQNLVHAERFYVRHMVYDREHLLHAILYKALKVINTIATGHSIKSLAGRLLLDFPEMPDVEVSRETFSRLKLSRKEDRYREALLIAKMILLNYRPDLSAGSEHVLALLFDMNKLWEEYVYRQLLKLESNSFRVSRQARIGFWHLENNKEYPRTIRPDLIIEGDKKKRIVVDTKWKLIEDDEPADDDLKQMFAYAHYFETTSCILLYPATVKGLPAGAFAKAHRINAEAEKVACCVMKLPIQDSDGEIRLDISVEDFYKP